MPIPNKHNESNKKSELTNQSNFIYTLDSLTAGGAGKKRRGLQQTLSANNKARPTLKKKTPRYRTKIPRHCSFSPLLGRGEIWGEGARAEVKTIAAPRNTERVGGGGGGVGPPSVHGASGIPGQPGEGAGRQMMPNGSWWWARRWCWSTQSLPARGGPSCRNSGPCARSGSTAQLRRSAAPARVRFAINWMQFESPRSAV